MIEFLPCSQRKKFIKFQRDGTKVAAFRCAEATSEFANQTVTPEDCEGCLVRKAVIERDVRAKAYTAPVYPALVNVKSKRPDTKAGSGFPACADRLLAVVPSCCGQTTELRVCDSLDAPTYQANVTPMICRTCKARREE